MRCSHAGSPDADEKGTDRGEPGLGWQRTLVIGIMPPAAKFVEQSLAMRRMANYLKVTTTYLSVVPESWVPPAPLWFFGLVKNVRRNLPI